MMAMMENMKKMMEQCGGNPFGQSPATQQGASQRGTQERDPQAQRQEAAPAGMPGMGPQDPKVVAEQLKTSLEAIRISADYLKKSDFVK